MLLLLTGGVTAASSSSLPGELLYPVKIASERTRLALTLSDIGKAKLEVTFAERRAKEIAELARKGKADQGTEEFFVVVDIANTATPGHIVDVRIPVEGITLSSTGDIEETVLNSAGSRTIVMLLEQ